MCKIVSWFVDIFFSQEYLEFVEDLDYEMIDLLWYGSLNINVILVNILEQSSSSSS